MVATDSGVLQAIGQQTFEENGDDDRDPPDGIEEEIDTLMASLSDKVCRSSSTHAYDFIDGFVPSGYHRTVLCCKIPLPDICPAAAIFVVADRAGHHRTILRWPS
jgi:hypothetical protein